LRVLLAVADWPWPPRKGHRLRTLQLAAALARRHQVTLLAPGAAGAEAGELAGAIERYRPVRWGFLPALLGALGSGRALEGALFAGGHFRRRLAELAPRADRVVLQLARLASVAPQLGTTPFYVDLIDCLSLNLERRAAFERRWARPLVAWEARRMAADERRLVGASAGAFVVCERDRRHLVDRVGLAEGKVHLLPLVVEPRDVRAAERPAAPPDRPRLIVTGNLGYFPTTEGIGWLLTEIWPELRARWPGLRLQVAGSRPGGKLRRLLGASGGELVEDPADLGALLRGADVALVPLRAGSGTPIKLLEAMAEGIPAIATRWAVAGVDAELAPFVAAADSPAEWRAALAGLLGEWERATARAAAGRRRLLELHAADRLAATVEKVLEEEPVEVP